MENQEKNETSFTPRKNLIPNQYKWDYYLIAIPIICIILFPLGVLFYFCGRFNFHPALMMMGIYLLFFLLKFGLFLISVVRLLRKNLWKEKSLIIIEICLPVLFFSLAFLGISFWGSKDPFLCGYRDQFKSKIDIEEAQSWLKTISEKHFTADQSWTNLENIPDEECPEYLKKRLHSVYSTLRKDEFGNPVIRGDAGGGFFHWGFVIGLPDLIYSKDQINRLEENFDGFWMFVQPGFYVFCQE